MGGVLRRKWTFDIITQLRTIVTCSCYLRENIEKRSVDVGSTGDSLDAVTVGSTG